MQMQCLFHRRLHYPKIFEKGWWLFNYFWWYTYYKTYLIVNKTKFGVNLLHIHTKLAFFFTI